MEANVINSGRIIELFGQRAKIYSGGKIFDAVVSGKIKHLNTGESPVAVGDFVECSMESQDVPLITSVIQRKSSIKKPFIEKDGLVQVIVSNVDRIIIVSSTANPAFKPGIIDRFLVTAFKEKIQPVIILNKIDIRNGSEYSEYLDAWEKISCLIFKTSAKTGVGVDALKQVIESGTSVVVGHSGVGKSSLLNLLNPEFNIKTKKVSSYSDRGVHTTSKSTMYKISVDGWIVDTPGLKVLGFSDIDPKSLKNYYPEFFNMENSCKFDDCVHINEPDCGVKESLSQNNGRIAQFRYDSYKRIYDSLG